MVCDIEVENFQTTLINSITSSVSQEGYTINDCILNTLTSLWYVDIRLNGVLLVQDLFYTGYGGGDVPTDNQWITALTNAFNSLQTQGIGYELNENTINVYSLDCDDTLLGQKLQINVGVNINIKCEE